MAVLTQSDVDAIDAAFRKLDKVFDHIASQAPQSGTGLADQNYAMGRVFTVRSSVLDLLDYAQHEGTEV